MTKSGRPNLAGLFSGTTPPERSSRISEALGPRSSPTPAAVEPEEVSKPAAAGWGTVLAGEHRTQLAGEADHRWPRMPGIDPVRAVDRYFEVLQAVLDLNRAMAIGWANTVKSAAQQVLPRR